MFGNPMNSVRIAFIVLMLLFGILPVSALAETMKADEASRFSQIMSPLETDTIQRWRICIQTML